MEAKNGPTPRKGPAKLQATEDVETPSDTPVDVFVISPIGEPGSEIHQKAFYALKYIFRRALPQPDWKVHRADDGKISDSIGQHVIRSIVGADLIIADLTGHNPNVFYELAVAHAFKKPVVHLITKGERLPFDVFDQRTIHYDITDLDSVELAVVEVREYAQAVLENVDNLVTPLTSFDALSSIRTGQGVESGEALANVLEQVLARMADLENSVRAIGRKSSSEDEFHNWRRTTLMMPSVSDSDDRMTWKYTITNFRDRLGGQMSGPTIPSAKDEEDTMDGKE